MLHAKTHLFAILFMATSIVACTGTASTVPAPRTGQFASEAVWAKPDSGTCPPGTVAYADTCAVCRTRSGECEAACVKGDADACSLQGASYEIGTFDAPNYRKAADLFQRGCDLGSGEGCEGLARLLMRGEGRPRDEQAAVELYERMCSAGRSRSCTAAGIATIGGRGGPADVARGLRLIQQACAGGDVEGCILGSDPNSTTNIDAAVEAARTKIAKCARGDVSACEFGQKPLTDLRTLQPPP